MKFPRLTLRTRLVLAAGAFTLLTQVLLLVFLARSIDEKFELDTRQRITATSSMLNAALGAGPGGVPQGLFRCARSAR